MILGKVIDDGFMFLASFDCITNEARGLMGKDLVEMHVNLYSVLYLY